MIKLNDTEVTLNFTGANLEGYTARLALGLLVHDHSCFSPEEGQRINTILNTIEDSFTPEENQNMLKPMAEEED